MKINEKNLAAFAAAPGQVDKEGYLSKKGEGGKGPWVRRYFVLKGNLLFYFERKGDRDPLGLIILEGSTVELAEAEEAPFCFKVNFPSKSYLIAAENQGLQEQWMKAVACASYDYVKLMTDEYQRQLDELCRAQAGGASPVPTPPPRPRMAQPAKMRFGRIHDRFGLKIMEDVKGRWEEEGLGGVEKVGSQHVQSPLSVPVEKGPKDLLTF